MLVMTLSWLSGPKALAQSRKCDPNEAVACHEALTKADLVMKKQEELIQKLGTSNDSLKDENDRLSQALIKSSRELDHDAERKITIGAAGILLGILAGVLVSK